jgi:hypothetical protein
MGVTSAGGEAEMCEVCSLAPFFPLGLRGFFAVVACRGVWRLPAFFVAAGASESGEGRFIFSAVFVFFGTGVQWLK